MPSGWRIGEHAPTPIRLRTGERTDHVYLTGHPQRATAAVEGGDPLTLTASLEGDLLTVVIDGLRTTYTVAQSDAQVWLGGDSGVVMAEEVREAPVRPDEVHSGDAELVSPMPGSVVVVGAETGSTVSAGTVVVGIEAMKMEHQLSAPVDGTVELLVAVGDQVKVGQVLARITVSTEEISS